jgi:hypothetical protein
MFHAEHISDEIVDRAQNQGPSERGHVERRASLDVKRRAAPLSRDRPPDG